MKLIDILKNVPHQCLQGRTQIEITDIVYDSRKVVKGCVFFCLKGANVDGHRFIADAVKKGAAAILLEDFNGAPENITIIKVQNSRQALALASAEFFGNPAERLTTIGITGTKGKTTTACMVRAVLEQAGHKTGLIGTLGVTIGDLSIKTENTTPESYEVQKYMSEMVKAGCSCVVMEVSSLGLKWHRIDGFVFDYGIFTNFSPDHIGANEHENLQEYLECKSVLFEKCRVGVLNKDDENFENILKRHTCEIKTFGFAEDADFTASNRTLISKPGYLGVRFDVSGAASMSVDVSIPGSFSVYNALAAVAVCKNMGIPDAAIIAGLGSVKVKGRVEPVAVPGNYTLLIDYAHNAVSMENILNTLREYRPSRLVTMFGAGGNRARARRYEMGEISGKLSDLSVITADNSRDEDVLAIIDDIKIGLAKTTGEYVVIPDRKDAIRYCIENAKDGDIIVLAGKGHEDYQEIRGVKHHFDEREIIADILKTR